MKKTLNAMLALTMISPLLSAPAYAAGKSIYGEDNRIELYNASPETRRLADSVVSFWKSAQLQFGPGDKTVSLKTVKFADALGLCPGETFREQPMGAFCSGSLVGEDLIMTAGHCIKNQAECDDARLVFGFGLKSPGADAAAGIGRKDVYTCKKVVTRFLGGEPGFLGPKPYGPDYALIQLDRKVVGRKPLAINRSGGLKNGDKLMVIGHPVGLPLKIAAGATVRDVYPHGYFVTDLDTFGGNSGSPVFNAATKLIEGILVRGGDDFEYNLDAGCMTMAKSLQNGGRGEDVTRISALKSFIPELAGADKAGEPSVRDINAAQRVPAGQYDLSRYFNGSFN